MPGLPPLIFLLIIINVLLSFRAFKDGLLFNRLKFNVKPKIDFKIGDQVRLFDGKSVGTIDAIEKRKAVVNYGVFTTQVNLEALDLVEAAKK